MAADEAYPADPARTGVKDRSELRALTSVRGIAAWFVVPPGLAPQMHSAPSAV